jgi:hypothetical protein
VNKNKYIHYCQYFYIIIDKAGEKNEGLNREGEKRKVETKKLRPCERQLQLRGNIGRENSENKRS